VETPGRKWVANNDEEFRALLRDFRKRGYYVHVADPASIEEIKSSPEKAEALLKECISSSLREWLQLAEGRLKDSNIRCYISPGNDDYYDMDPILNSSDFVINPEERVTELGGGYEMITLGNVNTTPWNCPRDVPEEVLSKKIDEIASKVRNIKSSIFNLHAPPLNTNLDIAPELDENLGIVMKAGQPSMVHVGSLAVRQAIEKYKPLLSLHGHIHESKAVETLGRTICINPGSSYSEGDLNAVIVYLGQKVKDYMFVSG
jgi:Icc-related predicted phosphoesterase